MSESSLIIENCSLTGSCITAMHMYEKLVGDIIESGNKDLIRKAIELNGALQTGSKDSLAYRYYLHEFKYKYLCINNDGEIEY